MTHRTPAEARRAAQLVLTNAQRLIVDELRYTGPATVPALIQRLDLRRDQAYAACGDLLARGFVRVRDGALELSFPLRP